MNGLEIRWSQTFEVGQKHQDAANLKRQKGTVPVLAFQLSVQLHLHLAVQRRHKTRSVCAF